MENIEKSNETNAENNNKHKNNAKSNEKLNYKLLFSILVIALIAIGITSYVFSGYTSINVEFDGASAEVDVMAFPINDIKVMEKEILDYSFSQMNDPNSNISSIKEEIRQIANNYGFSNININIKSQFGEDQLPMLVSVDGTSMMPTLKDGENIIILKTKDIKVGDIVVVRDSDYSLLIKRVGIINGSQIFLSADNNDTTTVVENGMVYDMVAVEKWTNRSNVVGVAKIFNV